MRDNHWLNNQLNFLLKKYFSDVAVTNPIEIKFGREAKYRFGSIRLYKGDKGNRRAKRARGVRGKFSIWSRFPLKSNSQFSIGKKIPQKSIITITSIFAKESVPAEVVGYTICHELCHYVHGFSSTNKRLFKYPHHGGIVNKELSDRGAEHLIHAFKKWLKGYRLLILSGRVSV